MWVIVAALLFAVPAHGGTICPGLAPAKAADLFALPGENPFSFEWLPPGVLCTSPEREPGPAYCRWSTTVTRDDSIAGGRRLVVAAAAATDGPRWDYVFAFGCVGGRIRSVFHDRFHPGVEIVEATSARIVAIGSDQPDAPEPRRNTFYWNDELESYSPSGPGRRTRPAEGGLRCDDIGTVKLEDIRPTNRDGFRLSHGMGCYSEIPEIDPDNCGWMTTLEADRPLGANRRLVVVGRDHRGGVGSWSDVFVFACTGGRVATLFTESYDHGASVQQAGADAITVGVCGWNTGDAYCCPSRGDRLRYEWNEDLRSYVLRTVESRPRARTP